jgi:hypothetical protein
MLRGKNSAVFPQQNEAVSDVSNSPVRGIAGTKAIFGLEPKPASNNFR